jgi:UDP-N-acetylglucosamine/UDP-N-acetyl-alpha-D-glucosaminouronate 4-epimerase
VYLVTGGAGFIGSHIVDELVRRGEHVRVLDDMSNGLERNVASHGAGVELVRGDIRDVACVDRCVHGVDVVLHLAALGSVARSVADPATTNDVNVTGTLNVLRSARDAGVRRVIFSSSSSVYGENPALPKHEDLALVPVSPYAVSKLAAEAYTRVFARLYTMETVCLRYFNVFGPRQRPDSQYAAVIPRFMQWAHEGAPLVIYGDGQQSRDFTYVANVVAANLLAANAPGVSGRVFNVACGDRYSLIDIVKNLEAAVGRPLEVIHEAPRAGDVRHSQADVGAAREALGYEVSVSFSRGLALTWEAFAAQAVRSRSDERA